MASVRKLEGKAGTTYKITVCTGRDNTGKQIRHFKTWKPPEDMTARQIEKEVKKVAYEFEQEILYGFHADNRQTFTEFSEYFVSLREQQGYKPGTIARFRHKLKRINKAIGHLKLCDIRPKHLNDFYYSLAQPGANNKDGLATPKADIKHLIDGYTRTEFAKLCGVSRVTVNNVCNGRRCTATNARKIEKFLQKKDLFDIQKKTDPLSRKSICDYHAVVSAVFTLAEREMLIVHNPAKRATLPLQKREYNTEKVLQPEVLYAFLDALETESIKHRTLFTLMAVTGCRRGEILGLKWDKVDLIGKTLKVDTSLGYTQGYGYVEGETKTGNIRYISLPDEIVKILTEYKRWQTITKKQLGDLWQESGHVFTNTFGGYMNPGTLNTALKAICIRHGLPHIHPHMFRHTAASIMITSGVDVLTVSKMLGHTRASTTTDIYGHAIEEAKRGAVECIADNIIRKKNA